MHPKPQFQYLKQEINRLHEQHLEEEDAQYEKIRAHYTQCMQKMESGGHVDVNMDALRERFVALAVSKAVRDNDCVTLAQYMWHAPIDRLGSEFYTAVQRDHFDVFQMLTDRVHRYGHDVIFAGLNAAGAQGKEKFVEYILPFCVAAEKPQRIIDCVIEAGRLYQFHIVSMLIPHAFVSGKTHSCLTRALIDQNYEFADLLLPHADLEAAKKALMRYEGQDGVNDALNWIDSHLVASHLQNAIDVGATLERTRKM